MKVFRKTSIGAPSLVTRACRDIGDALGDDYVEEAPQLVGDVVRAYAQYESVKTLAFAIETLAAHWASIASHAVVASESKGKRK